MALIISADEIKKEFEGYDPKKVEKFHTQSAKLADKQFDQVLKTNKYSRAILLNGGTASGKTEFLATQLANKRAVIFDTTMATILGAEIKIKKILKSKKKPIIYSVIPDDLKRAFIAFLNRDRQFRDIHFYRTHSGSRETLLSVAQNYPEVEINIVVSYYDENGKMKFKGIEFDSQEKLVNYLQRIQKSENDILTEVKVER
jgi:hypothetical protein